MMVAIERKYRALILMERIQQLAGEAMMLEEECPQGPEQNHVHDCWVTLCKASDALQSVPTASEDLETVLTQSIENVREQKQREPVKARVLPFAIVP